MAGDEQWAEPVEILDAEESTAEVGGGRDVDWHRLVRTGAAVVAALSLLWIGRSMADERADQERTSCVQDIQSAYSRYEQYAYMGGWDGREPPVERSIVEDLADRVRACGGDNAELFAEALLYEPDTDEDED